MHKKRYLTIPVLAAALLAAAPGCEPGFGIEEFKNESGIGLTIKGKSVFQYDSADCQLGFNESRNEFWVTDDTMGNYFILKCRSFPEPGSTVKADLVYTTETDIKTRSGLTFQVVKFDTDSELISLWSQAGRIGAIVKVLR